MKGQCGYRLDSGVTRERVTMVATVSLPEAEGGTVWGAQRSLRSRFVGEYQDPLGQDAVSLRSESTARIRIPPFCPLSPQSPETPFEPDFQRGWRTTGKSCVHPGDPQQGAEGRHAPSPRFSRSNLFHRVVTCF